MTWRTSWPPCAARRHFHPATTCVAAVVLGSTVATLVLLPRVARAEGGSPLVLPLLAALAVVQQATEATREPENPAESTIMARARARALPLPTLRSRLPSMVKLPDPYSIDYHRDARRWAEPIDASNMVAFDLWPTPVAGFVPLVSYDQETRFIGASNDVIRFEVEMRW